MDFGLSGLRILWVEDDLMLGETLQQVLQQQQAHVDWHKDGERLRQRLQQHDYDLIILDVGLPHTSGFQVLARLRQDGHTVPVMMLTARDQVSDRVYGLDLGADDYMVKPFDLNELLARIRALVRRSQGRASPMLQVAEVSLDAAAHQVFYQQQRVPISRQEFRILQLLMENADRVITRDRLENLLFEISPSIESNSLEVHIHHLRKKIYPQFITTLRGVGYMVRQS